MNTQPKRTDLGWANSDLSLYTKLKACRDAGHAVGEENRDRSHHGLDTLSFCNTCNYQFHTDSSD